MGVAGNWLPACSSCHLNHRQHHLRHQTPLTRNSKRDYCYDKSQLGHTARLYLLDRTGLARCDPGYLCSLPRRSGQGFSGTWVAGVGLLEVRVGGSGLVWIGQNVGHLTACRPPIPSRYTRHALTASRVLHRDRTRRSRLVLRQLACSHGGRRSSAPFPYQQKRRAVGGSSRHGMLESIPPWMAAGLLLLCNTRLLVVC